MDFAGRNGNFPPGQFRDNPSTSQWIKLLNSDIPLTLRFVCFFFIFFFKIIVNIHVNNIIFFCSLVLVIFTCFPRNEPKAMKY